MLKIFRVFLIGIIVLFNPITGLIFGLLSDNGTFIKWESLGKPPEVPTKILAADVRDIGVYVQTTSGQIYEFGFGDDSSWVKRTASEVHGYNFIDCLMGHPDNDIRHIQDEVDNYPVYWCGEWDFGHAYYAIRKDGSVWVWKYSSDSFELMKHICGYPLIGLITMILFGVVLAIITKKQKKESGKP